MLTQLSTVKSRLGLTEFDVKDDAILTNALNAVSARFDKESNRTLARTIDATHEFTADVTEISVPCYPIETVTRFKLRSAESEGWIEQPTTPYLVRRYCVISLPTPLGTAAQQARLAYTGGFVLPGATPGPGQTPLPADLEQAAVEQVAAWYQNRDKLGLKTIWPPPKQLHAIPRLPPPPRRQSRLGTIPKVDPLNPAARSRTRARPART